MFLKDLLLLSFFMIGQFILFIKTSYKNV